MKRKKYMCKYNIFFYTISKFFFSFPLKEKERKVQNKKDSKSKVSWREEKGFGG